MLLACSLNTFGRQGLDGALAVLGPLGVSAIQLPIRAPDERTRAGDPPALTSRATEADVVRLEQRLAAHGLTVASCHVGTASPLDPDAWSELQRKLALAQRLGVRVVVGGAGEAYSDAALQTLYARLRELGDLAGGRGLTYCTDVLPGVCQNHRWMLRVMEDLQHPHLRLNFDPGLLLYYNENPVVEVALAKCCHLVRHVQLKDSSGEHGRWHFPALGDGVVDFLRIYQLLRDTGFAGPVVISIDGSDDDQDLPLDVHARRLADSLVHLRRCGFRV